MMHRHPQSEASQNVPRRRSNQQTSQDQSQSNNVSQNLCQRCKSLNILQFISDPWTIARLRIWEKHVLFSNIEWSTTWREGLDGRPGVPISRESLTSDCDLCVQFTRLFFQVIASEGVENNVLELRLQELQDSGWKSMYLSIFSFTVNREICFFPTQAVFVQETLPGHMVRSNPERVKFARACHPRVLDFELLRGWISDRQSKHIESCGAIPRRGLYPSKLIDCKLQQVCSSVDESYAYVCLSYVWGSMSTFQSVCGNRTLAEFPTVVSDAIVVTLQLGMRYLWVDRYCIDQDNPEEKHRAIQSMDSIYEMARCTIVAATGNGPHDGLAGISRPRRYPHTLTIGDHSFVFVENPKEQISRSKWNSRGWTYQEMLLSRRRLVFTESQVFFECQSMCHYEHLKSISNATGPLKEGFRAFPRPDITHRVTQVYEQLEKYYKRELSFSVDIINACVGIFYAFGHSSKPAVLSATHFYGIPIFFDNTHLNLPHMTFALGLTWIVYNKLELENDIERDNVFYPALLQSEHFPAWSWASFKAQHPSSGPGRLMFMNRPDLDEPKKYPEDVGAILFNDEIRIRVTHRSGVEMDLSTYISHPDDYTKFKFHIIIESMTTSGQLSDDGSQITSPGLSSCPIKVHVHLDVRSVKKTVTAVLAGIQPSYSYLQTTFLLVEQISSMEHRLIGMFDFPTDRGKGWEQSIRSACTDSRSHPHWNWEAIKLG